MQNSHNKKILVFGEVLFDDFGDPGIVLGGAPFNVAWHLQGLGFNPLFVSRVGQDQNGHLVRQRMQDWGMTLAGLQTDKNYPTGLVTVDIIDNEPKFKILADQAYDQINVSEKENILSDFPYEVVYHGTLALRNKTSYYSLKKITGKKDINIFLDVNLRDPWWQADRLIKSIKQATWVKCNDEEFKIITTLAEISSDDEVLGAWQICQKYNLDLILVTLGAQGARIVDVNGRVWQGKPKPVDQLADTVGAGDGFSAVTLLGLLLNWDINILLNRAIDFAAQICQMRGAICSNPEFYQEQQNKWK